VCRIKKLKNGQGPNCCKAMERKRKREKKQKENKRELIPIKLFI
jgi:hypothetical protein